MLPVNSLVYLETSAANFMADAHLPQDGKATQLYYSGKGTHFFVSPVTLWEILLTKDTLRREKLIFHLQHFADSRLLKSPAEIILEYIEAGCHDNWHPGNLSSTLPLARVWEDLCEDNRRTILYNSEDFQTNAAAMRAGFDIAQKMVTQFESTSSNPEWLTRAGVSLDLLARQLKTANYEAATELNKKHLKVGILLMSTVLCNGVGFDNVVIEKYWKRLKIQDRADRVVHLLTRYESLLYKGPLAVMSHMIVSQMQPGCNPTRGVLWDSLHSVYLLYSDVFFSNDQHFQSLRDEKKYEIFRKIVILKDSPMIPVKTVIYDDRRPWYRNAAYFIVIQKRKFEQWLIKIKDKIRNI